MSWDVRSRTYRPCYTCAVGLCYLCLSLFQHSQLQHYIMGSWLWQCSLMRSRRLGGSGFPGVWRQSHTDYPVLVDDAWFTGCWFAAILFMFSLIILFPLVITADRGAIRRQLSIIAPTASYDQIVDNPCSHLSDHLCTANPIIWKPPRIIFKILRELETWVYVCSESTDIYWVQKCYMNKVYFGSATHCMS